MERCLSAAFYFFGFESRTSSPEPITVQYCMECSFKKIILECQIQEKKSIDLSILNNNKQASSYEESTN
ncbi:hypothetical protein DERP_000262 [Dermatophagoides pteronyssinus]|uniref:Uncharacterized protein n=1 Tax=Dermatophagoides pteronyssinus TaxID=6956 RepID=A0ABQ8IZN4_DERPT|nr:hypothetical protein DERP_000262 [Dermatophagoides pteronyssinus]